MGSWKWIPCRFANLNLHLHLHRLQTNHGSCTLYSSVLPWRLLSALISGELIDFVAVWLELFRRDMLLRASRASLLFKSSASPWSRSSPIVIFTPLIFSYYFYMCCLLFECMCCLTLWLVRALIVLCKSSDHIRLICDTRNLL